MILSSRFKFPKQPFRFGLLSLLLLLLLVVIVPAVVAASVASQTLGKENNVINRQLQASIVAPNWPTTPESPLCEAFAFIDSTPTQYSVDRNTIRLWKRSYLEALMARNSSTAVFGPLSNNHRQVETDETEEESDDTIDNQNDNRFHPNRSLPMHQMAVQSASTSFSKGHNVKGTPLDLKLLEYALSTRAHAPFCEMHRSLAQGALSFLSQHVLGEEDLPEAFVLLEQNMAMNHGRVSGNNYHDDIHRYGKSLLYANRVGPTGQIEFIHGGFVDQDVVWAKILPNEEEPLYVEEDFMNSDSRRETLSSARADVLGKADPVVAILYGSFRSNHFTSLYHALVKQRIPFLVRHMALEYERSGKEQSQPTVLQGYGVRLDIRNVEYKSFDDNQGHGLHDKILNSNDDIENPDSSTVASNQDALTWKDAFTNGIDPTMLVHERKKGVSSEMIAFFRDYLPSLESMMEESDVPTDHVLIPPKSKLRHLSIQAAMVISQSKDPLWTLQLISQNLPSFAAVLSNITLSDEFLSRVENAHQLYFSQDKAMGLKSPDDGVMDFRVNGRSMKVDRPSFNLFELINVFREENELMRSIDDNFGFNIHLKDLVTDFITIGKDAFYGRSRGGGDANEVSAQMDEAKVRIDVGSGYRGAVIYLNDIEKDIEYRDWPKSVERAIYSVQFGGPLVIRRNVFTVLLVLDPLRANEGISEILRISIQMIQSGMPLRVGIVFVNDSDIQRCEKSLERHHGTKDGDCSLFNEDATGFKDKDRNEITSQTVMKVFQYNVRKYGKNIRLPYLYLLLEQLHSGMSIQSFANTNNKILQKLGIKLNDSLADIKDAIQYESSTSSIIEETYHGSLRFAVRKNIKSGDAFLNGIPLSLDSYRDYEKIISEEMQLMLGKMMMGEITDTSPRSIYAMLLKGRHVHSSMHPSLLETDPHYIVISHTNCKRLFTLSGYKNEDMATVTVDFITDFMTDDSLLTLSSFLESMKTMSKSESVPSAFRVFPSSIESSLSFLGYVFSQARSFSIDELIDVVKFALESPELRNCNQNPSLPNYEELRRSFAARNLSFPDCLFNADSVHVKIPNKYDSAAIVLINGRVFVPLDSSIQRKDLQVLMALENDSSKKIANAIANEFSSDTLCCVVPQVAAFLGNTFSSNEFVTDFRSNIAHFSDDLKNNMIHLSWNNRDNMARNESRVKVQVVLDPLTEAAQRVAPLLRMIRDILNLPLELIVMPSFITEGSTLPLTSYYRFVSDTDQLGTNELPKASFQGLPVNQVLTVRMDVAEPWDIQQSAVIQDTDNLRCDPHCCGDDDFINSDDKNSNTSLSLSRSHTTNVEYRLNSLLFFGQCYDIMDKSPPNGLQLTLVNSRFIGLPSVSKSKINVSPDGSVSESNYVDLDSHTNKASGTIVMKTIGYWQLRSNPGVWQLEITQNTRGAEIYDMVDGTIRDGHIISNERIVPYKFLVMKNFLSRMEVIFVHRKQGYENADLLVTNDYGEQNADDEKVHIFSLATGHLYERFLKIMMLSVIKRTSAKVKFWLFENYLSPSFKESALAMAKRIGCEVEFVTYKWPEWLRGQKDKQRIIWGYKILFLDVLFPLDLKKIIYVDADQVVRGDLKELWDMDLDKAPYGYTPMCESREETKGYQFWREGFWPSHLRGKPYHISALYVVDLQRFRRELVGDQLRAVYQQLTVDPNNLSNLDQDLPNYTQHQIKIFSLPQDWLWCETWCSEESKKTAKTIDLCNNPQNKEAKVSMAKRIIHGELFHESWDELDAEVARLEL